MKQECVDALCNVIRQNTSITDLNLIGIPVTAGSFRNLLQSIKYNTTITSCSFPGCMLQGKYFIQFFNFIFY